MKSSLHTLLIASAALGAPLASSNAAQKSSKISEIPYGIEALSSYRSEYNYRGFTLAQEMLDLQLSAQYAFSKHTYLTAGLWYGSATGQGDFSEAGILVDLNQDIGDLTLTLSSSAHSYSQSTFESGANLEAGISYHLTKSIDLLSSAAYDTGAEGWYSMLGSRYYLRINDDSFVTLKSGISAVSDYYQRDGLNDAFATLSYTYDINQSLSVSPFIGTSVLLDSADNGSDSLYGGVHFAVSF